MSDPSGHAMQRHGELLVHQGRYAEAEEKFREALQSNPHDDVLLHQLSLCQYLQNKGEIRALVTIRDAIAQNPNLSAHHALHSKILSALNRNEEAATEAQVAVTLSPDDANAHDAVTFVLLREEKWSEAEASARRALALDADDSTAANHLSVALRLQNKMDENEAQIRGMLERDPEDSMTHASAGWSALHAGNRKDAERHFLESLRLTPGNEPARDGLLEAFKSRSPIYRAYLHWCFFMQRLSGAQRWGVIIGAYVLFRFSRVLFTGSMAPLGITITVAYLIFVLWSFLARGVGGALLLFDRLARHILTREEKLEGAIVGCGVLIGIPLIAIGIGLDSSVLFLGATLLIAAVPAAVVFHNASLAGRILYGAIALYCYVVGFGLSTATALNALTEVWFRHVGYAVTVAALSTWCANLPFFRRAR